MELFIDGKSYGEVQLDANVVDYDGRPSIIKHSDWKVYNIISGMVQTIKVGDKVIFENKQLTNVKIEDFSKTSIKVDELKVFEFEAGGESDWVIALNQDEAKEYYLAVIDDIEEYEITELENWHDHNVRVETSELQADGSYYKNQTMLQMAKKLYADGYDEPTTIASTYY